MRCALCPGLLALLLAGCAGYRLGPTGGQQAGATSVQVLPFVNRTLEPRLTDAVTSSLRKQFQQDGTFRLETRSPGDVVVSGVLVEYDRQGVSYRREDTLTPRDYRVTLTAQVTARQRATGKMIFDRKVSAYTTIRTGVDLVSAERQALPLLAEDLARNITTLLADGAW